MKKLGMFALLFGAMLTFVGCEPPKKDAPAAPAAGGDAVIEETVVEETVVPAEEAAPATEPAPETPAAEPAPETPAEPAPEEK